MNDKLVQIQNTKLVTKLIMAAPQAGQNLYVPLHTRYIQTLKSEYFRVNGSFTQIIFDRTTDRLRKSPQTEAKLASHTSSAPVCGRCSNGKGRHRQMEMRTKTIMSRRGFMYSDGAPHSCSPSSGWFRDVQVKKRRSSTARSCGVIFWCWWCVIIGNGHPRYKLIILCR
jgi:hypothetical protein